MPKDILDDLEEKADHIFFEEEMDQRERAEKFILGHLKRNPNLFTEEILAIVEETSRGETSEETRRGGKALLLPPQWMANESQVNAILLEAEGIISRYLAIKKTGMTVGSLVTTISHRSLEFRVVGITRDFHLHLEGIVDPLGGITNDNM